MEKQQPSCGPDVIVTNACINELLVTASAHDAEAQAMLVREKVLLRELQQLRKDIIGKQNQKAACMQAVKLLSEAVESQAAMRASRAYLEVQRT